MTLSATETTYANYYHNGTELLYDRVLDPAEFTNLADDPANNNTLEIMRRQSLEFKNQYTRAPQSASVLQPE